MNFYVWEFLATNGGLIVGAAIGCWIIDRKGRCW